MAVCTRAHTWGGSTSHLPQVRVHFGQTSGCQDLTRSAALFSVALPAVAVLPTTGSTGSVFADHLVLFADLPSPATRCSARCAFRRGTVGCLGSLTGLCKGAR